MKPIVSLIDNPAQLLESGRGVLETRVGSSGSSWLDSCYRMRYRYFVKERGWVNPTCVTGGFETDQYDGHSHHIAVFEGEQPLAYLRALPCGYGAGVMLDKEFSSILSVIARSQLEREGAVELSRLVVAPQLKKERVVWQIHPVEYLLKALYHLAIERSYGRFYIVVEDGWPQVFARRFGLPFKVMGDPYTFADGTRTVAAVATLAELEEGMRQHSVAKYDWYRRRPDEASSEG